MELKQLLCRRSFWLTVLLGMAAITVGTPFYEKKLPLEAGDFVTLLQQGMLTKTTTFVLPLLAVLPVGGSFLNEYQSGFLRFYVTRISKERYVKDKVKQTVLGGFLTVLMVGAFLFLTFFLVLYPLEVKGELPMEPMKQTGLMFLRMAGTAGILANLSGICGALFLNYYMSYGLPFVAYYMLVIIKERYLPDRKSTRLNSSHL